MHKRKLHNPSSSIILLYWIILSSGRTEAAGLNLLSDGKEHSHLSRAHDRVRREDGMSSINEAEDLIPRNYSIHEPPPADGYPIKVEFYVLIVGIRDIDEVNEQLSLELNLQMYWKDTRLSHLTDKTGKTWMVLNPILINQIWHPDVYIDHVKKIEQPKLISTPASLRIYPDETIRYSARLTLQMACPMDFHFYPADTQFCKTDLKSYAYSNKILDLDWREGKEAAILRGIKLPSFEVGLGNTQNFSVVTSSGTYSGIRFTVILRRTISFHMLQTYFPSALFVIISFLSFLVAPESIPGRMTLCMTTLLTLVAIFSSVRQNTPTVSYVKGIDIWMVACIICVFLTLLEYTVLLKLRNHKPKQGKRKNRTKTQRRLFQTPLKSQCNESNGSENNQELFRRVDSYENKIGKHGMTNAQIIHLPSALDSSPQLPNPEDRKKKKEELSYKIEEYCSKIIPALFILFNLVYWPWLLKSAAYFDYDEIETTHFSE